MIFHAAVAEEKKAAARSGKVFANLLAIWSDLD